MDARLGAIAELPPDEQLQVRLAYLTTPTLVDREAFVAKVKRHLSWAAAGNGNSILVTGEGGMGRSRFVDACVLEAKLAGALVLRTDAADSAAGPWGAAQALGRQLLRTRNHGAPAPVLVSLFPELRSEQGTLPSEPPKSPQELRAALLTAFREWILSATSDACVLVAADDFHRLDEPSAALLALLSSDAHSKRLTVLATAETGAEASAPAPLSLLSQSSAALKLRPLSLEHTQELLASVFGEVQNVRYVATHLQAISGGKPRELMQLAQHLVDTRLVRYEAGAWTLPSRLDPGDLPPTLGDALKGRLGRLEAPALELAQTLALAAKKGFSVQECLALSSHGDGGRLRRALGALTAADIVTTDGTRYSFSHPSWEAMLAGSMDPERARLLHARVAEQLATEPMNHRFRAAHHWLLAGERDRALDALLEYSRVATPAIGLANYLDFTQSLSPVWLPTYTALIRHCEETARPRLQAMELREAAVNLAGVTATDGREPLRDLTAQLVQDSGLAILASLDDGMDASARTFSALQKAVERYERLPPNERVYSPTEAVQRLYRVLARCIAMAGRALDYALLEWMPSLTPFTALTPATEIMVLNHRSTLDVLAGRMERAREGYERLLDCTAQPDTGLQGEDLINLRNSVSWALGVIEIQMGIRGGTRWADAIESSPLFEVNAWRLRLMNAVLQADLETAERCKKHLEILRIQNRPTQMFEGSYLSHLVRTYAVYQDFAGIRTLLPELEAMAAAMPTWAPVLHCARGLYAGLRGDWESALAQARLGLETARPGRHVLWSPLAGLHITSLLRLGRLSEAKEDGDRLLADAKRAELDTYTMYVSQPLALVESALGHHDVAVAYADDEIRRFTSLGSTGALLGSLYETRVRVALAMGDVEAFQQNADLCAKEYRVGHNPPLTARFDRLMQEARRSGASADAGELKSAVVSKKPDEASRVAMLLAACRGPRERAERALRVLLDQLGLDTGFLYTLQPGGPTLAAFLGVHAPPSGLDTAVGAYLERAARDSGDATGTIQAELRPDLDLPMLGESLLVPLVLGHDSAEGYALAGAVVVATAEAPAWNQPYRLLAAVSRSLMDSGDVATVRRPESFETSTAM